MIKNTGLILIVFSASLSGQSSSWYNNSAVNYLSLPIDGINSTAFGKKVLYFNQLTAANNTGCGYFSLYSNRFGNNNTAFGAFSLANNAPNTSGNIGGNDNTAIGYNSLYSNTIGNYNTAGGYDALYNNISGSFNTGVGYNALWKNITANFNTAIGGGALFSNDLGGTSIPGEENVAIGYNSLYNNLGGTGNTANGFKSLFLNTEGIGNTAFGYYSLYSNSDIAGNFGNYNTAFGYKALFDNRSGDYNIAVGSEALVSNINGFHNIAFGCQSMKINTTGYYNIAIADFSNYYNLTGYSNIAIGTYALYKNQSNENCAIGTNCLSNNTTGTYNSGLGVNALTYIQTGNGNTTFGAYSDLNGSTSQYNSTAIGYGAIANNSNEIYFGDSHVTKVEMVTGILVTSDGNFKSNVDYKEVKGLDFISRLRPVTYNFEYRKFGEFQTSRMCDSIRKHYINGDYDAIEAVRQVGFLAQEVEQAAKQCGYDFHGIHVPKDSTDSYCLSYGTFVVPLVKAVQEQQEMINRQDKRLAEFNALLQNSKSAQVSSMSSVEIGDSFISGYGFTVNVQDRKLIVINTSQSNILDVIMLLYDLNGKIIKSREIAEVKNTQEIAQFEGMESGFYNLALVINGELKLNKKVFFNPN